MVSLQASKLPIVAAAAAAVGAPTGLAAAAAPSGAADDARTGALAAPLAGHRSLASQMRAERAARSRRERAVRRAQARARARRRGTTAMPPVLRRIAECESHGNPRAIGGGGTYRGAYQFTTETWRSVGGRGDPAAATMAEQTRRAALLLVRSGPGQWPVCSQ